jgi:hypothetical protein
MHIMQNDRLCDARIIAGMPAMWMSLHETARASLSAHASELSQHTVFSSMGMFDPGTLYCTGIIDLQNPGCIIFADTRAVIVSVCVHV